MCQLGSFAITCRWIRSRNAQIVENQLNYMEASVQEKTMDIQRMLFGIQVNDTFDQALRRLVFNGEENPVYAESEISRILSVNKGTMPLVSNLYVCSPDFLVADMTTLRIMKRITGKARHIGCTREQRAQFFLELPERMTFF